jgi:hypothetical protein
MADVRRLIELGMPAELAKEVANQIDAAVAAVTPSDITGFDTAVEEAVAAKTEIAALTGGSTAANIVTALQA